MADKLQLHNVSVRIGEKLIIDTVSFTLQEGDVGCLLGASGCGKTTLLRTIAGFERPANGEIYINGKRVSDHKNVTAVEGRNVGMVFQDSALFPHLSVRDNIMFGLRNKSGNVAERRLKELAGLLEITNFLDSYPHRLSGGQQQRVALARAMAPRPEILLLDEPFASMDIALREQLAGQVREVLKQDGITAVLVTHNQLEAFAMADQVGVIRHGCLLQWDRAFRLYHEPVSLYVADFVGEGVFIKATVTGERQVDTCLGLVSGSEKLDFAINEQVQLLIRPDDILHDDDSELRARVVDKTFRGAAFIYTLVMPGSGERLLSLVPSHHDHAIDEEIGIRLEIEHLVAFAEGG
ncbi:MAG: ABC transporter ATP-binding protein [Gammaproteobacteria bacterium]